ncbi:hypothetical protein H5398_13395 [Tessaracoccus sp. MC1679]|uniref:DUF6338 family protein n=1 Tax=Tessaracoccus sp. MC1679 TaxID=2760313 RepID=UPI001601BE75|nr:DUF6338 family protein [Tessaracoccus sp. MC1679]MBB1516951.1 hypothetical protein [Tessaracoccus sp. MC1679]
MGDIPSNSFAVAAVIVLALPGIIFSGVRHWLRGERPGERNPGLVLARSFVFSVVLAGVYLMLFGGWLFDGIAPGSEADTLVVSDPRAVGGVVTVFFALIPALIALIVYRRDVRVEPSAENSPAWIRGAWTGVQRASAWVDRKLDWLPWMTSRHGYIDIASPWEKANRDNKDAAWVKIQRENGQWIGGWLTHGSLAAAYPEQHQLYIDQQYEMTADGDFGDALTDTGVWIVVGDKDVVSWIKSGRIAAREEQAKQNKRRIVS